MNRCFAVPTASLTILAALALTVQMQAAALPADPAVDAASKATQTNPPALPRVDLQGALIPITANGPANAGEWQIIRRDAYSQTWESLTTNRHPVTGRISTKPRRIVQLGSGLNYLDDRGQWQPTRPEFVLQPDGTATVRTGPFKVTLPPSLGAEQGIRVVTPDGTDLHLQVLGVGWFDPVSGKSALLGEYLDVPGELVSSNQVVYRNAFRGLKASVQYTYSRGGFSQYVILEEAPRSPGEWGLSDRSRLEVYSEIISASKAPVVETRVLRKEPNPAIRAALAVPDLTDSTLAWGSTRMTRGRAFKTAGAIGRAGSAPVVKQLEMIDGRQILIEACDLDHIRSLLDSLPRKEAKAPDASPVQTAQNRRIPLERLYAANQPGPTPALPAGNRRIEMSRLASAPQGFVMDYELQDATDFTFLSDTTYWVTHPVYLYGTTRLEGGAVIKYASSETTWLATVDGQFLCETEAYRPAIFTSMNDDTIGEIIPGSTGSPVVYQNSDPYIGCYLDLLSMEQGIDLKYVQFRYAHLAVAFDFDDMVHTLSHAQFVHCQFGVYGDTTEFHLRNALFYDVSTPIVGTHFTATAENVTVHQASQLAARLYDGFGTVAMTNSLLVQVASDGDATLTTSFTERSSSSTVFQTVGAGAHYLAANSAYRNAGTADINPQLRDELRLKTTFPPEVVPQGIRTTDVIVNPSVSRDNDTALDLGYHYEPIDKLLGAVYLQNAHITLNPGAVAGVFVPAANYYGFALAESAFLDGAGDPLNPARLVFANQVQEQANAVGVARGPAICYGWGEYNQRPTGTLRFTECFIGQQEFLRFYYEDAVTLRDCRIRGGQFSTIPIGASQFINCWWDRTHIEVGLAGWTQPFNVRNCLFTGGALDFIYCSTLLELRDNVFDRTALTQDADIANSHNAYVTGETRLTPSGSTDKVLASFGFLPAALGKHYLPTDSQLINAGSRTAADAGLYHHTTQVNQEKDGLSTISPQVDIGFHYPVLNEQGALVDSDADGLSDLAEDANGDGIVNSTETSYLNPDTDGDSLSDYQEVVSMARQTNPLISDTDGDGIPDGKDDNDQDYLSNKGELELFGTVPIDAFSLNKASNGRSVTPDGPYLAVASQVAVEGDSAVKINIGYECPFQGSLCLWITGAAANSTYDIFSKPDWFQPFSIFLHGNPDQVYFQFPNPGYPMGIFVCGLATDFDGDGLSDGYEALVSRTLIDDPDTDNDDMPDGWEEAMGLNPKSRDSNGNGVPDGYDDSAGDADGLADAMEAVFGGNPKIADNWRIDSDGDGLPDVYEVNILATNPNSYTSPALPALPSPLVKDPL